MYRLNSILVSHFILALRSIYLKNTNTSESSTGTSTVQFGAFIQSNLGATLDDSWIIGRERDIEDEPVEYSGNPLATGLLSSVRSVEGEDIEIGIERVPGA